MILGEVSGVTSGVIRLISVDGSVLFGTVSRESVSVFSDSSSSSLVGCVSVYAIICGGGVLE